MFSGKILRRFLIPGSAITNASNLPIYTEEEKAERELCPPEPGSVEKVVGAVRGGLWNAYESFKGYSGALKDIVSGVEEDTKAWTEYLRKEENIAPRSGAIGIGGFTGYILGLRGGFFRRITYASVGALSMAALCYPNEAVEYSQLVLTDGKKYVTIAYNFIYGVKRGENSPQLELPELPKIPSSFSEAWGVATDFARSAQSLITDGVSEITKSISSTGSETSTADTKVQDSEVAHTESDCGCPDDASCQHITSAPEEFQIKEGKINEFWKFMDELLNNIKTFNYYLLFFPRMTEQPTVDEHSSRK